MTHRRFLATLPSVLAVALIAATSFVAAPAADARKPTAAPTPTPTPTPSPTAAATYLEGVDVSQWQGTIDWAKVVAAGKRFAFVRASAGTLTADTTYAANHANARSAGMLMGAYHFANPGRQTGDAVNEADWFLQNASLSSGDLLPVLDVEANNDGMTAAEMQAWVGAWLQRIYDRKGLRAIIYTSPNFWSNNLGNTTQFSTDYPILWVAHWTSASAPTVPASNWGGKGWTFWQYSSQGIVSGISGQVDLDRYKGTSIPSSLRMP